MADAKKSSVSALCELTGLDRATIGRRLKNLPFTDGAKNAKLYNTVEAMKLLVAPEKSGSGEDVAKERKLNADADRAELRVMQLRGELVSASDMKQAAAELVKTLYQRIVRVTPTVLSSQLINQKDPIEIETIIRLELAKTFDELRTMPESYLSVTSVVSEDKEDEE